MKKTINSIIFSIAFVLGAAAVMHGSKLILQTYRQESVLIEVLKTGSSPEGEHAQWVKERGDKEGTFHILLLCSGVSVSLLSLVFLSIRLTKKKI